MPTPIPLRITQNASTEKYRVESHCKALDKWVHVKSYCAYSGRVIPFTKTEFDTLEQARQRTRLLRAVEHARLMNTWNVVETVA